LHHYSPQKTDLYLFIFPLLRGFKPSNAIKRVSFVFYQPRAIENAVKRVLKDKSECVWPLFLVRFGKIYALGFILEWVYTTFL